MSRQLKQTKSIEYNNPIKGGMVLVVVAMVLSMFFGGSGTHEVRADDETLTPTITVTATHRGICTEFQC